MIRLNVKPENVTEGTTNRAWLCTEYLMRQKKM